MKKTLKLSQAPRKTSHRGKAKPFSWSTEKSAELRKAAALPSGGDCNCAK